MLTYNSFSNNELQSALSLQSDTIFNKTIERSRVFASSNMSDSPQSVLLQLFNSCSNCRFFGTKQKRSCKHAPVQTLTRCNESFCNLKTELCFVDGELKQ